MTGVGVVVVVEADGCLTVMEACMDFAELRPTPRPRKESRHRSHEGSITDSIPITTNIPNHDEFGLRTYDRRTNRPRDTDFDRWEESKWEIGSQEERELDRLLRRLILVMKIERTDFLTCRRRQHGQDRVSGWTWM